MFGDDSDEETPQLTVNKKYAEAYDNWRQKEELQKLKDRYGDADAESESETESDDLDERDLDPKVEKGFLAVLSALKSKDSKLYDESVTFYDLTDDLSLDSNRSKKSTSQKPMFLKDYERHVIVDKEGKLTDETEDSLKVKDFDELPYVEKQEKLKASFKLNSESFNLDDEDFLTPRVKSLDDQKKEEEEYLEWLKGRKVDVTKQDDLVKLKSLHDYWNDPNLEEGERFLKDFILNKRYLEKDSFEQGEAARMPTYDEIVSERGDEGDKFEVCREDLEEDEKNLEAQEQFEHKYNFRFEEPDADFIKSYPRTIKDSLRRADDRSKKKREAYKERKEREKEQKRQEMKRLKSLKRKEIVERIKKVKAITGNDHLPLDPEEFERDFDPAQYDQLMSSMFDDKYYEEGENEEEKPVFSSESEAETDEEKMDKMSVRQRDDGHGDSGPPEEFSTTDDEETSTSAPKSLIKKAKRPKISDKKESKFLQAVKRHKPLFSPGDKTFEQYFDEYYKLDYEDIIGGGDTVCRFKYRKVTPNDFGLSTEEILFSNPKELNTWVSIKKMSQYRQEKDEAYDVTAYRKKAQDFTKKHKILYSYYHKNEQDQSAVPGAPTDNEPKHCVKCKHGVKQNEDSKRTGESTSGQERAKRKVNKRRKTHGVVVSKFIDTNRTTTSSSAECKPRKIVEQLSDDRLKAFGINPKKLKNKMKYSKNR